MLRNSAIESDVLIHLYSSVSFWGANFSEAGGKTMRPWECFIMSTVFSGVEVKRHWKNEALLIKQQPYCPS